MTAVDDYLDGPARKLEPKRNRYGQYLLPDPSTGTETAYQRVTTFAKLMGDTYALDMWNRRMVAKGLTLRPDLYAQVAAATLDEKALLNTICEQAGEAAGTSEGRNKGSALHRFAERVDAGETDLAIPPPFDRDIAAYRQAMTAAGITCVAGMSERIVVVPDLGVAGTFDRLLAARWPDPRVGDLKTAQSMYGWLEIAIQLALYAHGAAIFNLATQTYEPMPKVDQAVAVVMHVPAGSGTCTLYDVDIAAGWQAAQTALEVRTWRKRAATLAKDTGISAAAPLAAEGGGGGGSNVSGTPGAATPGPPRGLVYENLARRVQAVIDAGDHAVLMALQAELNRRGLPRLSEATAAQLPEWVQAANAVLGNRLDGGTQVRRADLTARVQRLTDTEIDTFKARLAAAGLAGLSATPDERLGEWERVLVDVEEPPFDDIPDPGPGVSPGEEEAGLDAGVPQPPADGSASSTLRVRYEQLPADLRAQVDAARAGTLIDGVSWPSAPEECDVADKLIAVAEVDHRARVDYIRELVAGWPDDNVALVLGEIADAIDVETWTAVEVERLEALVDAIDRTIVAFTVDGDKPQLVTSPVAVERLVDVHGNRGDVLKAARVHAKTLGRPTPRTAQAAASDPLLAALTARKTA